MEVPLSKTIKIYNNGSFDLFNDPPTPTNFAIVRIPTPEVPGPFDNTVMAAAVNDQVPYPMKITKGDTIPCRAFFPFMSKIMTIPADRWAKNPHVLWINKRFFEDIDWPDYDAQGNPPDASEPVCECIEYPMNIVAYDYRIGDWFRLITYKNTEPPLDPMTDNWFMKPWLWGKAQALSKDGLTVTNVGDALHVYLPAIKKSVSTWMHLSQLELFPPAPLESRGYILRGASIFMNTAQGIKALRLARAPGELIHPYPGWSMSTRSVIPEVRIDWIYPAEGSVILYPR
jgi:hypothetical protein